MTSKTLSGLGGGFSFSVTLFLFFKAGLEEGGCLIAPSGYEGDCSGLYAKGGGARQLGEYFHEAGKEGEGDKDLALLACTVEESTTYFSILDCLLAKSSAPLPRKAGISKAEPIPEAEPIPGIVLAGMCDGNFDLGVFEFS